MKLDMISINISGITALLIIFILLRGLKMRDKKGKISERNDCLLIHPGPVNYEFYLAGIDQNH